MFFSNKPEKTAKELRRNLIDDSYAIAFGGGIEAALLEISDIERMGDKEIIREANKRGLA